MKDVSPLKLLVGNIFDKFDKMSIFLSDQVLVDKEGNGWAWYYEVDFLSETHNPVGSVWLRREL